MNGFDEDRLRHSTETATEPMDSHRAREGAPASEDFFRRLVEAMADDAILVIGADGRIDYGNRFAARQLSAPGGETRGKNLEDLFDSDIAAEIRREVNDVLQRGASHQFELRLRLAGRDAWVRISLAPLKDATGGLSSVLAVGRDVTDLVAMREELRSLSLVDALTGLYNRRGFAVLAGQQLMLVERTRKSVSLLMGDLDGLKTINDAYGHREGDFALWTTARILKETCRNSDVVGRLGGDEFAILAVDASPSTGTSLAARLKEAIDGWNASGERPYPLSISVGTATSLVGRPEALDSLIARADALMYEEKRRRRADRTALT